MIAITRKACLVVVNKDDKPVDYLTPEEAIEIATSLSFHADKILVAEAQEQDG